MWILSFAILAGLGWTLAAVFFPYFMLSDKPERGRGESMRPPLIKASDDIPRRVDILRITPAEQAIRAAVIAVENLPADTRLTEAVMLLMEAREYVADYVDNCPYRSPRYSHSVPSKPAAEVR